MTYSLEPNQNASDSWLECIEWTVREREMKWTVLKKPDFLCEGMQTLSAIVSQRTRETSLPVLLHYYLTW